MQGTRARTVLALSVALLATLAGCNGRVDSTDTLRAAHPGPATAQRAVDALPAAPAPSAPAAGPGETKQVAVDGNVHSLGASGGTSVLDPDVLISEQVKTALATRPEFGASSQVAVSSRDGAVTLRGRAPDPEARERATAIARSIRNVKDVDNQLTLG
jgi:hyperosmotically inducible periplasmic protein